MFSHGPEGSYELVPTDLVYVRHVADVSGKRIDAVFRACRDNGVRIWRFGSYKARESRGSTKRLKSCVSLGAALWALAQEPYRPTWRPTWRPPRFPRARALDRHTYGATEAGGDSPLFENVVRDYEDNPPEMV